MVAIPTVVGVTVTVAMVAVTVVVRYYAFVVSARQGIGVGEHELATAEPGEGE